MLIQLPLEVWMEILEWLRGYRRKLAAKINQLGDRSFVEICQHWLHKYSKNVQLGELWIKPETVFNNDGDPGKIPRLMVSIEEEPYEVKVPFAQVPMPANITGFVALQISYLDSAVLDFLRLMPFWTNNNNKIRLNIEASSYHLNTEKEEQLRTALGHFQGLCSGGIEAVLFNWSTAKLFTSFLRQFRDLLFSAKLLVLDNEDSHYDNNKIDRWLGTERADGEPRMAVLYGMSTSETTELFDAIREQFLANTAPISFFVAIYECSDDIPDQLQEASYENDTTGEQLIVRMRRGERQHGLLIGRCPAIADGDGWLQQMEQKVAMPEKALPSWIYIGEYDSPPMLVTLDTPQIGSMESEEDGNDDNDDQQPGPSKRRN